MIPLLYLYAHFQRCFFFCNGRLVSSMPIISQLIISNQETSFLMYVKQSDKIYRPYVGLRRKKNTKKQKNNLLLLFKRANNPGEYFIIFIPILRITSYLPNVRCLINYLNHLNHLNNLI